MRWDLSAGRENRGYGGLDGNGGGDYVRGGNCMKGGGYGRK